MAISALGNTFNTTTGTHTVVATPAVGDLIVIVSADSGFTGTTTPTDNNADGLGAYTLVNSALKNTSADILRVYVRNSLVGNASSTTFSQAAASSTGGGLIVYKITGMPVAGASAIRQSAVQANQAAAGTPTPVFGKAVLTGNPVIGAVFNGTSPATMTPRASPAYTEDADVGYSTPTTGFEAMHVASGETGTSIAWGGTSASAFSSIAVEINATPLTNTQPATARIANTLTKTQSAIAKIVKNLTDLSDNFNDNSTGAIWSSFANSGTTIAETGGQVVATLANAQVAAAYAGYDSAGSTTNYALTGSRVWLQVPQVANVATHAQTYLKVAKDGSNALQFIQENGILYAQSIAAGVTTTQFSGAYNSTSHAWWRIRESGGTTFWEVSSDGLNWNAYASVANPFTYSTFFAEFAAGTYQSEASPGSAIFDNFNIGVTVTKTQPAVARIANTLTKTQGAVARIQNTVTKTQPAVGRIANNIIKTQPAIGRIANTKTKTQPAIARIATNPTKTQPAIARIQRILTKTQPAIARIATIPTKTQPATARIANVRTKTQSATANIQPSGALTFTQTATARIANTLTKTQSAIGRIAVNLTKTQPAVARIANIKTKTQPAVGRIAVNLTKTQPAVARIQRQLTKTQPAKAAIQFIGLTKTQPAIARISNTKTKTQPATARVANTRTKTQSATANIQPHTTYYVSAVGSDANSGTDIAHPWQTIAKVNAHTFAPDDNVLFRGGDTFSGKIAPGLGGSSGHPIVFGSYGTGNATISNTTDTCFYLYNISNFEIHNLILTGGPTAKTTSISGITIFTDNNAIHNYILIDGVDVSQFTNGISIGGLNNTSGYSNVTVSNSIVHDNSDTGFLSYNQAAFVPATPVYAHSNFTLSKLVAYNNTGIASTTTFATGNGMVLGNVNGATIDQCTSHNNGSLNGCTTTGPVGIWTYDSNAVTIKRSVAYAQGSGTAVDGDGFDLDINTSNSIIEYCLAYSNYGAGFLAFGAANTVHTGNVFRYNIGWGNGQNPLGTPYGEFAAAGTYQNLDVYNNTFIARDSGTSTPYCVWFDGTPNNGTTFRNNIVYAASGYNVKAQSAYAIAKVLLQGNDYFRSGGLQINWAGTVYTTLAGWRAAITGQEVVSAANTGLVVDPILVNPATAPTVTDPTALTGANQFHPQSSSSMLGAGLPLNSDFGTVIGSQDYFGAAPASPFTIGASQGFLNTLTQPAIARIAVNKTKTQPATARVAVNLTKTQPATARISSAKAVKTQPATARIAVKLTKTQSATARINPSIHGGMWRWTGSDWASMPVKVRIGSSWVAKPLKKWNGAAWVLVN